MAAENNESHKSQPGSAMRTPQHWSSEEFLREAGDWIDVALGRAGIARQGALDAVRVRPWSAVYRATTSAGDVFFKACCHGTDFEVPLYELLLAVAPERILRPLASDRARGWLLLPDGGTNLESSISDNDSLPKAFEAILPHYAQMQLALAQHMDAMLSAGVSDMRPARMPARFDEACAIAAAWVERAGNDSERQQLQSVIAQRPEFLERCQRLAASGVPASIDHNDLHTHNCFISGPRRGDWGCRLLDWGDSVVSHPFASMLILMRVLKWRLKADDDDPRLVRLRDVYLRAFSEYGSREDLVAAVDDACHVGKVARALVWQRAVAHADPRIEPELQRAPFDNLVRLLNASYVG